MLPEDCTRRLRQLSDSGLSQQDLPPAASTRAGDRHRAGRCLLGYFLPQDLY